MKKIYTFDVDIGSSPCYLPEGNKGYNFKGKKIKTELYDHDTNTFTFDCINEEENYNFDYFRNWIKDLDFSKNEPFNLINIGGDSFVVYGIKEISYPEIKLEDDEIKLSSKVSFTIYELNNISKDQFKAYSTIDPLNIDMDTFIDL